MRNLKEEGVIQQEIDDERQRLIIGNPHYLFLELTLKNNECDKLRKRIQELYDIVNPREGQIYFEFETRVSNAIDNVKESLKEVIEIL